MTKAIYLYIPPNMPCHCYASVCVRVYGSVCVCVCVRVECYNY